MIVRKKHHMAVCHKTEEGVLYNKLRENDEKEVFERIIRRR
jgi:hypothetical protein